MLSSMETAFSGSRMESHASSAPAASNSRFAGKRVHFIGIGGCGMSGLARMLLDAGAIISGSEPHPNDVTFELTKRGIQISRDQIGELLSKEIDLVVRTAAVPDTNLEFKAAVELNCPTIKYAELLGQIMSERLGVAVAGTHGKSTTTAMISYTLVHCDTDPSFVVGGTVPQLGGGSRSGQSNVFVAEACEYDRSYLNLRPKVALLMNIEEDHLDCYKDIDDIVNSFQDFAGLVPRDGVIIANGLDQHVANAVHDVKARVERAAVSNDIHEFEWTTRPTGIVNGRHTGDLHHEGKFVAKLKPSVAGEHNLYNATMAVAACAACGVDAALAAEKLSGFTGVDRRMTEMGRYNGATVVDDYGHHPTEIQATLAALRERYAPKRLLCVFQPHQHSRTRFLLDDFATSFASADETIVPDIYFVRDSETEKQRVSSQDLVDRITNNGQAARYIADFPSIVNYLRDTARDGDLIVTMGAGNVSEIGRDVVEKNA